jgi:hypothetical protein
MKRNILITLLVVLTMGLFWSCKKDLALVNSVSKPDGLSFIKIIHASPNFRQVYKGSDSFNVYMNGTKLNAPFLTYTPSTSSTNAFPTATNLYAAVAPGQQSIRLTVNGVLTPDSLTVVTVNKTMEAGSYYSFIVTDEATNTNESRQMWLKDNFALTDTNNFTLRFVNTVLNDPAPVDVYSFQKAANIFTGVSVGSATPFISLPYTILTDTLYVMSAGTKTEVARINIINGSTTAFNRNRAVTLLYKGIAGVTGAKGRSLAVYNNN